MELPTCLRKTAHVSPQRGSPRDTGQIPGSCRRSLHTDRRSHPHHPPAKSHKSAESAGIVLPRASPFELFWADCDVGPIKTIHKSLSTLNYPKHC